MKMILLLVVLFVSGAELCAQERVVYHPFTAGDSISAEISINTNSVYQKGLDHTPVQTRLYIKRLFCIQSVSEKGYTVLVKTTLLEDSVNAVGQRAFYTTAGLADVSANSLIKQNMLQVLKRVDTLQVDRFGTILSIAGTSMPGKDLLATLANIQPGVLYPGNTIGFFSSFTVPRYTKGVAWKDYRNVKEVNATSDCTVNDVTDSSVTVKYSRVIKGKYENTNANGIELASRESGIVKERITQSMTTAYELIKENIVIVNKSCAVLENYRLIPRLQ